MYPSEYEMAEFAVQKITSVGLMSVITFSSSKRMFQFVQR